MKYVIFSLLWIAYCALHSYLISIRFTSLMSRLLKKYYAFYRLFYVLISLILLIPLINYSAQNNDMVIITYGPILNVIRYVLISGSLLMFFWAFFFDYDSLSFFGIRQILSLGKQTNTNPIKEIKRKGLLGIMRHPMYLALIIFLWCQTHRMSDIIGNTILTIYIVIGTWLEERKLVLEFGNTYIAYQREVPMLIPFTKARVEK
jgi:protein-S-isoprenylcysteine O-methyltransferase Ste14